MLRMHRRRLRPVIVALALTAAGLGTASAPGAAQGETVRAEVSWSGSDGYASYLNFFTTEFRKHRDASSQVVITASNGADPTGGPPPNTRYDISGNSIRLIDLDEPSIRTFSVGVSFSDLGPAKPLNVTARVFDSDGTSREVIKTLSDGNGSINLDTPEIEDERCSRFKAALRLGPPLLGRQYTVEPLSGRTDAILPDDGNISSPVACRETHPFGTFIFSDPGTALLRSTTSESGAVQTARVISAASSYFVRQKKAKGSPLELKDQPYCPRKAKPGFAAGRISIKAKGKHLLTGRSATASSANGTWTLIDRCDGSTLVKSIEGTVRVTDTVRHRKITLKAGRKYVSRKKR